MRNFFWQNTEGKQKIALIAWDKIIKPKSMGGLGIKDFKLQNKALGAKLVWKFIKDPKATWIRMMATKYLPNEDPQNLLRANSHLKGSKPWNFIVSCRNLISNSLSWDIHDGTSSLFWEDSWGGYPSIENSLNIPTAQHWLKQHWGSRVSDYMVLERTSNMQGWSWKSMEGLPISIAEIKLLLDLIRVRNINPRRGKDTLIWASSKIGQYNAKDGYRVLANSQNQEE